MAKINSDGARQAKRERWRKLLRRWNASGLSQAAFCRQRRLSVWQFRWWKKRLEADTTPSADLFVPVTIGPALVSAGRMELAWTDGRVLRFDAGVEPTALAAVVAALSIDPETLDGKDGPC